MLVLLLPEPTRFNQEKFIHLLSTDDQRMALTIRNGIVRAQFIAGRLLLKKALYMFNKGKVTSDTIFLDHNGKPKFKSNKIKFNISHTKELVACTIGYHEMGLDIEIVDRTIKLPDNITLRNWVWLEACAKLTGRGLVQIQEQMDTAQFHKFGKRVLNHYLAIATYKKEKIEIVKVNNLTFI